MSIPTILLWYNQTLWLNFWSTTFISTIYITIFVVVIVTFYLYENTDRQITSKPITTGTTKFNILRCDPILCSIMSQCTLYTWSKILFDWNVPPPTWCLYNLSHTPSTINFLWDAFCILAPQYMLPLLMWGVPRKHWCVFYFVPWLYINRKLMDVRQEYCCNK